MAIFDTKNDVFELIDKFDKSSLSELEISFGADFNVKLSKQNKAAVYIPEAVNMNIPAIPAVKQETSVEISQNLQSSESSESLNEAKIIKAPLIGTFYVSPSPDSEPYVKIGDKVTKGMVICIIEAMKTMNEIESDADGEIVEVLVKNGTPVEFGQGLYRVK